MNVEERILNGLVQVFTRGQTSAVQLRISDGLPIPSFDFVISSADFIDYLKRSDLSTLTIRELVDLGSLYFKELEEVLKAEMNRRKSIEPGFGEKLAREVMPRLRDPDNPSWRYQEGSGC